MTHKRSEKLTLTGATATGCNVVATARTYLGTPYRDFGRKKGRACDCIGLPVMVGHELGLFTGDFARYTPTPLKRLAEQMAETHMGDPLWTRAGWPTNPTWNTDVPLHAMRQGTVGLFWFSNKSEPQHFAMFADHPSVMGAKTIIHAHSGFGCVSEHTLDDFWKKRIVKIFALPALEN